MKSILKKIGNISFIQSFLGILGALYIIFVYKTCKWKKIGLDNHKKHFPGLFAFWHRHLLMIPLMAEASGMKKPLRAIVSKHRDGRFASTYLKFLKVTSIDGSTGKNGVRAGIEAMKYLKEGDSYVGICPDGPRGPAFKMSKGALFLARKANVPLYGMIYEIKANKTFNTWDKFQFPFPFSKGVMVITEPFFIPPDTDDEKLFKLGEEFEKIMNDCMKKARDEALAL